MLDKITSEHITAIIESGNKDDENSFEDSKISKRYNLIYVIIAVVVFLFLIVFLAKENQDLLLKIIGYIVAIFGGFGGGYGYKTYLSKKH